MSSLGVQILIASAVLSLLNIPLQYVLQQMSGATYNAMRAGSPTFGHRPRDPFLYAWLFWNGAAALFLQRVSALAGLIAWLLGK